ncbi:MAG: 50S ribosomal protein L11 methyltransferase [Ahrensia sp.]
MTDTDRQTRLLVQADKKRAAAIFDELDTIFEDDGYPLVSIEIDEAAAIFEVSLYVPLDDAAIADAEARANAAIAAIVPGASLSREDVPDIDWVVKTLEGLPPVYAERFLVHGSHDRDAVRAHHLAIEIEAGRAFGTGHHGTTAGCLEMLAKLANRRKPQRILDLGTGSAVLAIAAAKRCRTRVLATDIDPVAMEVATRNVRLNSSQAYIRCETATGFNHRCFAEEGPFDMIIANILPAPLMRMAPDIERFLMPGGQVILSGILTTQRRRVLSAFALQGLYHRATLVRGEWVTLHLDRGPASQKWA